MRVPSVKTRGSFSEDHPILRELLRLAIGQHLDIDLASPGILRSRTAHEGEHRPSGESAGWTTVREVGQLYPLRARQACCWLASTTTIRPLRRPGRPSRPQRSATPVGEVL